MNPNTTNGPQRPWGEPPARQPSNVPNGQWPLKPAHRWLGRNSSRAILIAILLVVLSGARAYRDLSSPSAWAYWKDLYFSPSLTSSTGQIETSGQPNRVLAIKGEIGAAAASWFRDRLSEAKLAPGDVVLLSSPGGRVDQALIMGEVIRSRGLTTMVGTIDAAGHVHASYCASACVLAYAGGKIREAFPGSALGVHQFTTELPNGADSSRDIVADTQRTEGMILEYVTRMGVSPAILQAMSATKEVRWLNETEALDLKLSTDRYASS